MCPRKVSVQAALVAPFEFAFEIGVGLQDGAKVSNLLVHLILWQFISSNYSFPSVTPEAGLSYSPTC